MNLELLKIPKKRKTHKFTYNEAFLMPFLIVLLGLVILPMILILFYSFVEQKTEMPIYQFTLSNYASFFLSNVYYKALIDSLFFAFIATAGCILLGYPIAYYISKRKIKLQATLILLVTAPMWINMLLRTLAVKQILEGPLLKIVNFLGFNVNSILGTRFAVSFGLIYNYIPFMILPIYTILSKLDYKLVEASIDLGANKYQTFKKVVLPLSVPGVLSGVTICFLSSATTLVISKYLGEGRFWLIGDIIEDQFINNADWGFGSAISFILLILIMVLMKLTNKLDKTNVGEVNE